MKWFKCIVFFVTLGVVFYYVCVRPLLIDISKARNHEKWVQEEFLAKKRSFQLVKNKSYENIAIKPVTQQEMIGYLINILNENGYVLEEIYPIKILHKKNYMALTFNVVALGEFSQLENLVVRFANDYFLININEIIMHDMDKKNLKIVMNLDFFNVVNAENKNNSHRQIIFQWLGFMMRDNKAIGLLKMANGDMQEVSVGSVIQDLSMKVLKIDKYKMLIKFKNRDVEMHYGQMFLS